MLPFLSQPAGAPACYVPRAPIEQSQLFNGSQTLTAAAALGGGTFACWIQRHALGMGTIVGGLAFDAADALNGSTGKYRDLGAYCCVVANADGVYVDGVSVAAGVANFGAVIGAGLKASLADVVFLSGNPHVPAASFVTPNIHGEPVPVLPSFDAATFGAKGFHLNFSNPLSPGSDVSGLGHNLTPAGFDATGKDTVASGPTNRFAAIDQLRSPLVITDGGLTVTTAVTPNPGTRANMGVRSGQWGWKATIAAASTSPGSAAFGVVSASYPDNATLMFFDSGPSACRYSSTAYRNATDLGAGLPGTAANDVYEVLLDADAGTLKFKRNGALEYTITGLTAGVTWMPAFSDGTTYGGVVFIVDFGQRGYVPSEAGYKTLCTDNLPEPDIKDPAEGYAAETGVGANTLAQLDAATAHWNGAAYVEIIKRRDASEDWRVRFSDDPANAWATNNTNAKAAAAALAAGGAYVGYRLRVGKPYGIYTAEVAHVTGTPTTVTHGLATARNAVIVTRVSAGGGDRFVFHPDMDAGKLAKLNSAAMAAADTTITAIGSSSFQITAAAPSGTYRVVVLAQRDGYLDLSKYTGGGDGSEAYAAMTVSPLLVISKPITGTAGGHSVMDAARSPSNPVSALLSLDNPAVEATGGSPADMLVGGLKLRPTVAALNVSGATYCTIAIGRPIGGVCVAPATAR